jgi:hypothetical protein
MTIEPHLSSSSPLLPRGAEAVNGGRPVRFGGETTEDDLPTPSPSGTVVCY